MLWDMGFSLPLAQNKKLKKSENQKCRHFLIFRCRYLPGIRLRKTTSRDLDFTHQANTSFRNPVQTQKSRFSDFPIQGELDFPINRSFRIFEAHRAGKAPKHWGHTRNAPKLEKASHVSNLSARMSRPEIAAPLLWAPNILDSFCRKTLYAHKILPLGGTIHVKNDCITYLKNRAIHSFM